MGQVYSHLEGYFHSSGGIEIISDPLPNPVDDINIEDMYPAEDTFDSCTTLIGAQVNQRHITTDSNRLEIQLRNIDISLDQVREIELGLEPYEKVSLVFLLYDSPLLALQELEIILKGTQKEVLFNWALFESKNGLDWTKKFTEALCIIQNYEVLKKLGYEKNDLSTNFLPTSEFFVSHIRRERKLLYLVCERLKLNQTKQFVDLVKTDLANKRLDIKPYGQEACLEMYFLHWITINYISVGDTFNFDNIRCKFKEMGLDNICDLLKWTEKNVDYTNKCQNPRQIRLESESTPEDSEVRLPDVESSFSGNKKYKTSNRMDTHQQQEPIDQSLCTNPSLPENPSGSGTTLVEKRYEMNPDKPGICIIINQINFYTERNPKYAQLRANSKQQLERRDGTEIDQECLKQTFEAFGFRIVILDNITHYDMIPEIKRALETVTKEESSVFLCILSHGDEGVVYGVNSCKVSFDDIKEALCKTNRKNLAGKPKALILQCCRGLQCQKVQEDLEVDIIEDEDITKDSPTTSAPTTVDLFTFYATVRGFSAIRNKKSGTWFINSLCRHMRNIGNKKHFEDICTAVNADISEKKWKKDDVCYGMVSEKQSTLRWSFYLPPLKHKCEVVA